jgi:hypothetical protein
VKKFGYGKKGKCKPCPGEGEFTFYDFIKSDAKKHVISANKKIAPLSVYN